MSANATHKHIWILRIVLAAMAGKYGGKGGGYGGGGGAAYGFLSAT